MKQQVIIDQRQGDETYTFDVQENEQLNVFVALTEKAEQVQVCINLCGPRARAQVKGVYLAHDQQQMTCITHQEHQAPDSTSSVDIRGLVFDAAQTRYEGTIFVGPEGTGTQARQSNKNMLFGAQARAVSLPRLEVLTNDVQCAHGSAVGRLEAAQLLYMQFRGLNEAQAKKLLLEAFVAAVLDDLPDEALKVHIMDKLAAFARLKQQ